MSKKHIIKYLGSFSLIVVVFVVSLKLILAVDTPEEMKVSVKEFAWSKGVKYYQYKVITKSAINFGDSLVDSQVDIDAVLQLKIFDVKDDVVQAGLSVSPVSVSNAGEQDVMLEKAYAQPVLAVINKNGSLEQIIYPNNLTTKEQLMLKGLYAPLEVILKDDATYEYIQEDSTGEYIAEYKAMGNRFSKKKKEYTSLIADMGDLISIVAISKSDFIFKPSDDNWVESVYGDESIGYLDDQGNSVFSADIKLSLKELQGKQYYSKDPFAEMSFGESLSKIKKMHTISTKVTSTKEKSIDDDSSLDELLVGLGERHSRIISLKMREYLLDNKSAIAEIPEKLLSDNLKDEQVRELINILGIISIPEAQRALIEIASSAEQTTEDRLRAVISFTSVSLPLLDESVSFLMAQLDNIQKNGSDMDIHTASVLAIGSISKSLMHEYPEKAAELADMLVNRLSTADSYQKRFLLNSIGNTASEKYSKDISAYLESDDPSLRRASAEALKYMSDDYSEKVLADILPVESDEDVIESVVDTLSRRELSKETIEVIRDIAPEQKGTDTRRTIIGIMGDTIKDHPENKETLTKMLANETSRVNIKRILKAAGNANN
ncbi:MAG: hypothetical protein C0603_05375 [Denitrovibrio sp.]|nr:MAG: hypothetical protein C0603_05375 [Denitrovibrio sp.]